MSHPDSPAEAPPAANVSPLVGSILDGSAPQTVRAAAARGALPLPRRDLLHILVVLTDDPDDGVQSAALSSLDGWPADDAVGAAAEPSTPAAVLAWLLTWGKLDPPTLGALAANPSTPTAAIVEAARTFPPGMVDVLLLAQTRIIQSPEILDGIEKNRALTPLQKDRVAEIRRHFLRAPAPARRAPQAPTPGPLPSQPPDAEGVPPAPGSSVAGPASPVASTGPEQNAPPDGAGAVAGEEPGHQGAYQRILGLNVTQKIALASRGDREERLILIRDSSRSVQVAVIDSPKLTESEVETISKMRSVKEEILRRIANRRDWMKSQQVVRGLASNPKTPLPIALTLLPRLTMQDLKTMISDRNLADTLRRMAQKTLNQKQNRGK